MDAHISTWLAQRSRRHEIYGAPLSETLDAVHRSSCMARYRRRLLSPSGNRRDELQPRARSPPQPVDPWELGDELTALDHPMDRVLRKASSQKLAPMDDPAIASADIEKVHTSYDDED
jgi:hypothetical protein